MKIKKTGDWDERVSQQARVFAIVSEDAFLDCLSRQIVSTLAKWIFASQYFGLTCL